MRIYILVRTFVNTWKDESFTSVIGASADRKDIEAKRNGLIAEARESFYECDSSEREDDDGSWCIWEDEHSVDHYCELQIAECEI